MDKPDAVLADRPERARPTSTEDVAAIARRAQMLASLALIGSVTALAVAGVFARTDYQRGVWKAPAGIDATRINALRRFPERLPVVWGARTLMGADAQGDDYKYVPVRRLALFMEASLFRGLKWVVFEPHDEKL